MNITTKTLLAGCTSLIIAACNKPSKSKEQQPDKDSGSPTTTNPQAVVTPTEKTPPKNFVKGTVSNQNRLSLDIDFENEAEDQITKENYKEKLEAFEKTDDKAQDKSAPRKAD